MSSKSRRKPAAKAAPSVDSSGGELASPSSSPSAVASATHRKQPSGRLQQTAKTNSKSSTPANSPKSTTKGHPAVNVRPDPTLPHDPPPLSLSDPEPQSPPQSTQPSPLFFSFYSALSHSSETASASLFAGLNQFGRVIPADPTADKRKPKLTDEQEKARKREREVEFVRKNSESALKLKAKLEAAKPKPSPPQPKPTESSRSTTVAQQSPDSPPALVAPKPHTPSRTKAVATARSTSKKSAGSGGKPKSNPLPVPVAPSSASEDNDPEMPDLLPVSDDAPTSPPKSPSHARGSAVSSDSVPTRPTTPASPPETAPDAKSLYQMAQDLRRREEDERVQAEQAAQATQLALAKASVKPIEIAQGGMVAVAVAMTAAATSPSLPTAVPAAPLISKPSTLGPTSGAGESSSSVSSAASSTPPVTPTHLPKKPPVSASTRLLIEKPFSTHSPVTCPPQPTRPYVSTGGPSRMPDPLRIIPPPSTASTSSFGPARPHPLPSTDFKGKGREQVPIFPSDRRVNEGRPVFSQALHQTSGSFPRHDRPLQTSAVERHGSRPAPRPPEGIHAPSSRDPPPPNERHTHGPAPLYQSSSGQRPTEHALRREGPKGDNVAERNLAIAAAILKMKALPPIQSTSVPPPPVLPSHPPFRPPPGPGGPRVRPMIRSPPSRTPALPPPLTLNGPSSEPARGPPIRTSPTKSPLQPLPTPPPPSAIASTSSSAPSPPPRAFTPTYATPASSAQETSMRATDFFLQERPQGTPAELRAKHGHVHRSAAEQRRARADEQARREEAESAAAQSEPRWIPPSHQRSGPTAQMLDEELSLLGLGRYTGRKTNFTSECYVHVESSRATSSRVELAIDKRELQLVCDLEFGPTISIQLVAPHHTRAFVKFMFIADAVKAMLASLPKSEKGDGGVLFGEGKRFVFEPKKIAVLALYREDDDGGEEWTDFMDMGEREDGGRGAWRKKREERSAGERRKVEDFVSAGGMGDEKADFECAICLGVLNNPHLLPCCGHTFCLVCIDTFCNTHPNCPHCRQSLEKTGRPVPNRFAKSAVDRFLLSAAKLAH